MKCIFNTLIIIKIISNNITIINIAIIIIISNNFLEV